MGSGVSGLNNKSGKGGASARKMYLANSQNYTVPYEPYARGQISKTDAGQLYKAVKNGDVVAKPELVSEFYDATNAYVGTASARYTQDPIYYDNVQFLTHSLLNKDYSTAQKFINEIQSDNISRASKKSKWYKYTQGR